MSSPVTLKVVINPLEQEISCESTGGSTTEDGPKKFRSLAVIYVDTLEEELDPDKLAIEMTNYVDTVARSRKLIMRQQLK